MRSRRSSAITGCRFCPCRDRGPARKETEMKHAAKPGRQLLSSLLAVLLFTGLAVALAAEPLLIGAIVPMKSRTAGREAFGLNELGEAMRLGALLAEEQFGTLAAEAGYDLKVLVATAPDAEAASR